jgi:hypothetical protein
VRGKGTFADASHEGEVSEMGTVNPR